MTSPSKVVLITGAGSGFGKLTAIALSARGHHVIATTETQEQADALHNEQPQLEVVKLDITTDDIQKVLDYDIDVLINNAGMGKTGPIADVPFDIIQRIFEVNVFGTLKISQVALKKMIEKKSGRIIILSSIAGVISAPSFGPYAMTKFALEAMGKAMRSEVAPLGVDVTLVNPGPYNTGFNDRMADSMWEWFGEHSLNGSEAAMFQAIREFAFADQLDPAEVAELLVELVEAEKTAENNFIPADIKTQLGLA